MKVNQSDIHKNWLSRGFSCDLWVDPPGQIWENYRHETDELFMVLEGKVELEIAGRTFQAKVGEEIFIPARAVHSVRNIGKSGSRWLYGYHHS